MSVCLTKLVQQLSRLCFATDFFISRTFVRPTIRWRWLWLWWWFDEEYLFKLAYFAHETNFFFFFSLNRILSKSSWKTESNVKLQSQFRFSIIWKISSFIKNLFASFGKTLLERSRATIWSIGLCDWQRRTIITKLLSVLILLTDERSKETKELGDWLTSKVDDISSSEIAAGTGTPVQCVKFFKLVEFLRRNLHHSFWAQGNCIFRGQFVKLLDCIFVPSRSSFNESR